MSEKDKAGEGRFGKERWREAERGEACQDVQGEEYQENDEIENMYYETGENDNIFDLTYTLTHRYIHSLKQLLSLIPMRCDIEVTQE